MNYLGWISFVLLFLFPIISSAQTKLISEYLFVVAPQDYNNFADENQDDWSGEVHKLLDDVNFAKPYKTKISGIKLHLDYDIQLSEKPKNDGIYQFKAKFKDTSISINSISTKDVEQRRYGPAIIDIIIKGKCTGVEATYKNPEFNLTGSVRLQTIEGKIKLSLVDYEFPLSSNHWNVSLASCTGFKGYDAIIKKNLQDYLGDGKNIRTSLEEGISSQLHDTESNLNNEIMKKQSFDVTQDIRVHLYPYAVNIDDQGKALVHGLTVIEFLTAQWGGDQYVSFSKKPNILEGTSQLILPQNVLQILSSTLFYNGFMHKTVHPQEYDELHDLFRSRWTQFWAWPDMMNFSKKADYIFDFYPLTPPALSEAVNSQTGLMLNALAIVNNNMSVPTGGGHVPYVNFSSNVLVPVEVNVAQRKKAVISFGEAEMSSGYTWDHRYLEEHRPNTYIDLDSFEDEIVKALGRQTLNFDLAPINLERSGKIYPEQFRVVDKNLVLTFSKKD